MPRKHPTVPEMTARERAIQRERVRKSVVTARYGRKAKGHDRRFDRGALSAMGDFRS